MENLPQDWFALSALVFALGMKHGFDADHLATIDGLSRCQTAANPRAARLAGVFFSLGHGGIVLMVALAASLVAGQWTVPASMEQLGAGISIAFLLLLGFLNLHAVWSADPAQAVQPVGLKSRMLDFFLGPSFARLRRSGRPWGAAVVGALFAFSFDTMSQAALFALAGAHYGGWPQALVLGLLFMFGMLLTDGLNGLWIARLIRRADQTARLVSRVLGLAVAGTSLLVAGFGIARLAFPAVDAWSEGKEMAFGLSIVLILATSFLLARRLSRRPALATIPVGGEAECGR